MDQRFKYVSGRSKGGEPPARATPLQPKIFSISYRFLENCGKIIGWRPLLEGWRPLLRGILDPPLYFEPIIFSSLLALPTTKPCSFPLQPSALNSEDLKFSFLIRLCSTAMLQFSNLSPEDRNKVECSTSRKLTVVLL